jgi:hypothetical protein
MLVVPVIDSHLTPKKRRELKAKQYMYLRRGKGGRFEFSLQSLSGGFGNIIF